MAKLFFNIILILILIQGCSYQPTSKSINPKYTGKNFTDRDVAIYVIDSTYLVEDEEAKEYLGKKYKGFEAGFKLLFPKYLEKYSLAKKPYFTNFSKTDFVIEGASKAFEPKLGSKLVDSDGKKPSLILTLCGIHFVRADARMMPNYSTPALIAIGGRVSLFDNEVGEYISTGTFSTALNIDYDGTIGRDDFDNLMKLLIRDVIYESPLYDEKIAFTYDNLK